MFSLNITPGVPNGQSNKSPRMGDSGDDNKTALPEWQKPTSESPVETRPSSPDTESPVTLDQARKFLQDEEVRKYPRDKKAEFLEGKGFEADVVERLLQEETENATTQVSYRPHSPPLPLNVTHTLPQETSSPSAQIQGPPPAVPQPETLVPKEDRPPIVTYPEFLTKPARPPPLMTVNHFLNTLYAFGSLSTLVYGTSKLVVAPMVDSLTSARVSLHETASEKLGSLVSKLEETVSEIPARSTTHVTTESRQDDDDAASEYDDPTELFHRDVGVQTSAPPSPSLGGGDGAEAKGKTEDPSQLQEQRLRTLIGDIGSVMTGMEAEGRDYEELKTVMGAFTDQLNEMGYAVNEFVGAAPLYGYGGRSNEPDDEIRKAKENIRRVKGVLLSARSFPAGR